MFFFLLQRAYARLEERDWLLVGDDKRPSVVGSKGPAGGGGGSEGSGRGGADGNRGEREFQIVILAKAGESTSRNNPRSIISHDEEDYFFFPCTCTQASVSAW